VSTEQKRIEELTEKLKATDELRRHYFMAYSDTRTELDRLRYQVMALAVQEGYPE